MSQCFTEQSMNYMAKTRRRTMRSLCAAKPHCSPCLGTSQDTLNLLGNSHLANYGAWPIINVLPPLQSMARAGAPLPPTAARLLW